MNRRELMTGTAAAALAVAFRPIPLAIPAVSVAMAAIVDPEDILQCEACGGVGWVNGAGFNYPDCRHCDGSGQMSADQVEAYWDRWRG
jgi:hypothetical protein